MTNIARKLFVGSLVAGLVALSGTTATFAAPRMNKNVKPEHAQTQNNPTLVAAPQASYPVDMMERDGSPTGRRGDGIAFDEQTHYNPWQ